MKQGELNKLINQIAKPLAKERGWKFSRGFIFKRTEKLFFSLIIYGYAKGKNLSFTFFYKWYDTDDLFWKIVELPENSQRPLGFRATGAWTAPMTILREGIVGVDAFDRDTVTHEVKGILDSIGDYTTELGEQVVTLDDNLSFLDVVHQDHIRSNPESLRDNHLQTVLCLILKGDKEVALDLIDHRITEGDLGGFMFGSKNFFTAAQEWLRTPHSDVIPLKKQTSPNSVNAETEPSGSRYTELLRRLFP